MMLKQRLFHLHFGSLHGIWCEKLKLRIFEAFSIICAGGREMQGNSISLHSSSIYVKYSISSISDNLPMSNALHSCTLYLQYYERTYIWRVK
jgi:hypothetical protein